MTARVLLLACSAVLPSELSPILNSRAEKGTSLGDGKGGDGKGGTEKGTGDGKGDITDIDGGRKRGHH